jgi:hypothetical protein
MFESTLLKEVELPDSVRFISGIAFNTKLLKSLFFDHCPMNFKVHCQMVVNALGKTLILYVGQAVTIVIAKWVETINDGCFLSNQTLESVAFKVDSVLQRIGESGFALCLGVGN